MNLQALHRTLRPLLRPLSCPYSLLMYMRRKAYRAGALSRFRPNIPCVSVGNIAWGGTGKTPFVSWLLEWAGQEGLRAVVLTRGYGGRPGKEPLEVRPDTPPSRCGDEPLMLARAHPEARVIAFPERALAARYAERYAPDLFFLDDGMQHLAIARHADIVLLRPEDLGEEWGRVIPAGSWREGPQALQSATAFAVKADPETFARLRPAAEKLLASYSRPLFSFTTAPSSLRTLEGFMTDVRPGGAAGGGSPPMDSAEYHDEPYLLVSGIGNPGQFAADAAAFTGHPAQYHQIYPDHHAYREQDIRDMLRLKLPILCTAKDAVKLSAFHSLFAGSRIAILESRLRFGPTLFTDKSFPAWWEEWWQKNKNDA